MAVLSFPKCFGTGVTRDLFIIAATVIFITKTMGDDGYKIRDKEGIHFVTFAVIEWVDVFTRVGHLSKIDTPCYLCYSPASSASSS